MAQRYMREIKWPNTSAERQLAVWLGLAYLHELYNFLGLKVILGPGHGNFYRESIQAWEMGGMFLSLLMLACWVWLGRNFRPKLMDVFKWSMLIQTILCILTVVIVTRLGSSTGALNALRLVRLVWAIILGLGLGVSFTILSRSYSRRTRTAVAAFVVAMGLFGPFLVTWLSYFPGISQHKWGYALFPLGVLLLLLRHWDSISALGQRLLASEDGAAEVVAMDASIKRQLLEGKFWRSFMWLLISGLNVQFCVNFLLADPTRFGDDPFLVQLRIDAMDDPSQRQILDNLRFELYRVCVFGRYVWFIAGVIFFGWLSSKCRSRKIPFLFTGSIGLVAIYVYIQYFKTLDYANWHPLPIFFLSGLIGLSNSNWLITLLQGIETYGRRLQFVVLFTLPMFYRFIAGVLLQLPFSENLGADQILMLGIAITLLGLFAAILWEENFEGANNLKISDDNVDKNFSVAILDHRTRQAFKKEIAGSVWKNENLESLHQQVMRILDKRFQAVFEEWIYSFSLASTNLQDGQLKFSAAAVVNQAAYRDLRLILPSEAEVYQQVAHDLILDGHPARSLTKFAVDRSLNGLVLTHKDNLTATDQMAYQENDYRFLDLSCIHLPDDATIAGFWQAPADEQKQLFSAIFEKVSIDARTQEDFEKIPEILTLRALDMWRYPQKQYFLYVITPQSAIESESQQRVALLLMTAIKIPVPKLDELAGMLNWLLTQRALALTMDAEWRKISEEQSHSMKTVLGMLLNDVNALNDYRSDDLRFSNMQESLEINLRRLDRINQFTLALMRVGEVGALEQVDEKVKKIFQPQVVNLQALIGTTLAEIERTIDVIGFSVDGHDGKVKQLIPELRAALAANTKLCLKVEVAPIGLQIVLTDLLSNMLFYTNSKMPAASIDLLEQEDAYLLCLTNNRKIEEKYRRLIETSKDQSGISIRRKAGIRMVKRILGSPLFNQKSTQRWCLYVAQPDPELESTTIVLKIVKTDCI